MWESSVKCKYIKVDSDRICQGDILSDLSFYTASGEYQADNTLLRYAVVMSQDCDLEQDARFRKKQLEPNNSHGEESENAKHDKFIHAILVCPAYPFDSFSEGQHLGSDWQMQVFNAKKAKKLRDNEDQKRYHYLEKDALLKVPELIIDFKHFYTLPRDLLYIFHQRAYIATVNELFRESLSQRFANYLSRFGLPELDANSTPALTPVQIHQ